MLWISYPFLFNIAIIRPPSRPHSKAIVHDGTARFLYVIVHWSTTPSLLINHISSRIRYLESTFCARVKVQTLGSLLKMLLWFEGLHLDDISLWKCCYDENTFKSLAYLHWMMMHQYPIGLSVNFCQNMDDDCRSKSTYIVHPKKKRFILSLPIFVYNITACCYFSVTIFIGDAG